MTLNYDLRYRYNTHCIILLVYNIHIDVGIIIIVFNCLRNESDFKTQSQVLQLYNFIREYKKKTV